MKKITLYEYYVESRPLYGYWENRYEEGHVPKDEYESDRINVQLGYFLPKEEVE